MKQTIRFRVDFTPACSLGPGKIELLETIEQTGSLRQAAQTLGMSYRRAWLLLDALNRSFSEPAAIASVGGQGGGGARLTAFGSELVKRYRTAARNIEALAKTEFQPIAAKALAHVTKNAAPRRKRLARAPAVVE
jgi:molybdate transport system regulatory protein